MNPKTFVGKYICIEKADGDENVSEEVVVTVTGDGADNGYIEIMVDDRNELVYLRFRLEDLVRAIFAGKQE